MDKKPLAPIRYHPAPACIALLYLLSLLIPWGLTCKLWFNVITPGQQSEDVNISGAILYDQTDSISHTRSLMYAIDAFNFASALASMPVIYALLARAAVVVSQRTKPSRKLNVRQLFNLADRKFLRATLGGSGTWLTWPGAALIILDFVGFDPPLEKIVNVPQRSVVERARNDIANGYAGQYHVSSWYEPSRDLNEASYAHYASSLPRIPKPGLTANTRFAWANPNVTAEICVPRDIIGSPWNNTNRDEQELVEPLYINLTAPVSAYDIAVRKSNNYSFADLTPLSITLNCTARTRLGYFELGNNYNGGKFGPILNKFPPAGQHEFTDGLTSLDVLNIAKLDDDVPFDDIVDTSGPTPGPLATVALALFGNGSFFEQAQHITDYGDVLSQALCRQSQIPFQRSLQDSTLEPCTLDETRKDDIGNTDLGAKLLSDALYYANRALLEGAALGPRLENSYQIWHAQGIEVVRPLLSRAAMVVISVLIGLQALGILVLVAFIYSIPTWTEQLDAMAVAKIAHQLEDEGVIAAGGLEAVTKRGWRVLEGVGTWHLHYPSIDCTASHQIRCLYSSGASHASIVGPNRSD
ncbi:hypothetical protein B0T22DRAFT_444980 [Podospora appendiculata]|uniref:Uncharacterized protein n=1 Tax=Podospora appendiculata TaxID=314037 RepID=A0AAE0X1G9_9PEZI|nr:hypothetical protein B0T22DRAFT_444980 [Podospora appendiculata]